MTLEELERSVKTLEAVLEIENMHRDFVFWLNNRQSEEWLNQKELTEMIECFTDNAVTEISSHGVQKGKEEITGLLKELTDKDYLSVGRYILAQPIITVEGDTAKGCWVLYRYSEIPSTPPSATQVVDWEQGKCDCEYVREGGKWKFSNMKLISPWPEPD